MSAAPGGKQMQDRKGLGVQEHPDERRPGAHHVQRSPVDRQRRQRDEEDGQHRAAFGQEGRIDGLENLLDLGQLPADDEHAADDPQGGDGGDVRESIIEGPVEEIDRLAPRPFAEMGRQQGIGDPQDEGGDHAAI